MSIKFSKIAIKNWRQFSSVSIDVHPRLTVITGANGAGKSTILNLFSQHFGFAKPFLSVPKRLKGGGVIYDLGYYENNSLYDQNIYDIDDEQLNEKGVHRSESIFDEIEDETVARPAEGHFVKIGDVAYTNGKESVIGYPEQQVNAYGVQIVAQQNVLGVQIGSHRTISAYQPIQSLSLQFIALQQAYAQYLSELNARMSGGHTQFSPIYRMKEALIGMAAFGEGNTHLENNEALSSAFDGFIEVLRKVLPADIGFQKLVIRLPDIVLKTKSGEFILDSSSGGVSAIMEISWQLYLFSISNEEFVVTLDEPENHLHPSMQRSILANLISAFPQAQFIVATHSPFIVSAVEDSYVYALKYFGSKQGPSGYPSTGQRRVRSIKLDQTRKAGSASEILREVLGVSVSIPDWAQKKIDLIVEKYSDREINTASLSELRDELRLAGFTEFYPDALSKLVKEK